MLIRFNTLKGHKVAAKDDEFGRISDVLVDDQSWQLRYFVVDTQRWLPGRKVVLAPDCVESISENLGIKVNLTKDQVEGSPALADNLPLSRQYEESLYSYYGWNPYWIGAYAPPAGHFPYPVTFLPDQYPLPEQLPSNWKELQQLREHRLEGEKHLEHLRSCYEIEGYKIHATDDEFGEVRDFIVETENWQLIDLVLGSRRWLPGGQQMICSTMFVTDVDHVERLVSVALEKDILLHAPEFDAEHNDAIYRADLIEYYLHRDKQSRPPGKADEFQSVGN
ncbi:MAG: hypothetical protein ACOH5I_14385 [Oligoflexus sp.]